MPWKIRSRGNIRRIGFPGTPLLQIADGKDLLQPSKPLFQVGAEFTLSRPAVQMQQDRISNIGTADDETEIHALDGDHFHGIDRRGNRLCLVG